MSHLVQLVDEHDNLVGHKHRDKLTDSDIWRISAIDVRDLTDEHVLVQKRSVKKKNSPGIWTIAVAGTLEENDTYESCAYRELQEEIGVVNCHLDIVGKEFWKHDFGYRQCMNFLAKIPLDTPLIIQEEEVDEVRWVTKDELRSWVNDFPKDFTETSIEFWRYSWAI